MPVPTRFIDQLNSDGFDTSLIEWSGLDRTTKSQFIQLFESNENSLSNVSTVTETVETSAGRQFSLPSPMFNYNECRGAWILGARHGQSELNEMESITGGTLSDFIDLWTVATGIHPNLLRDGF
ncbi:hypothetical protein [Shewanella algae]|uniref:hypothetical protein n=1 Tax=Shewanella algae TaxID=38313 RepID=UPI001BEED932|nr:hypothetical protein [Shewanella algae]BCV28474.1 hypothetical protein TUM3811_23340 [Shewanella algae]